MRTPHEANLHHERRLRLVRDDDQRQHSARSGDDARARSDSLRAERREHRAWEVGAENRAAAGATTFDSRWVMAVRVADSLEGGRAAVLRPEVRSRLLSTAGRLGLRPFDTNMVIAIVQDAARRGESPHDIDVADRLGLVGRPEEPGRSRPGLLLVLSVALAAMWAVLLLAWILR